MFADLILVGVTLLVLLIASIFDLKTREIPDTLSYGLIIVALSLRLITGVASHTFSYFLYGLLGLGVTFIFGYLLYHLKQMGGGDAKLLMGFGAAFGSFGLAFLVALALAILFIGGLYCFLWAFGIFVRYREKAWPLFLNEIKKYRRLHCILLALCVFVLVLGFLTLTVTQILLAALVVALITSFYLSIFIRVVEKVSFLRSVPVKDLTEGDWLAKDVKIKNSIILSARIPSLEEKHIHLLKEKGIKRVWIKVGIPFVPAYFLAVLLTVLIFFF